MTNSDSQGIEFTHPNGITGPFYVTYGKSENIAAALVGISGGWGWADTIKNHGLIFPEITEQYV